MCTLHGLFYCSDNLECSSNQIVTLDADQSGPTLILEYDVWFATQYTALKLCIERYKCDTRP